MEAIFAWWSDYGAFVAGAVSVVALAAAIWLHCQVKADIRAREKARADEVPVTRPYERIRPLDDSERRAASAPIPPRPAPSVPFRKA